MELIPDVQVFCFVWLEILGVRLIFTFAALHRIMKKGSSFQFRRQTNTIGYYKVESKYFLSYFKYMILVTVLSLMCDRQPLKHSWESIYAINVPQNNLQYALRHNLLTHTIWLMCRCVVLFWGVFDSAKL